MLAFAASDIKPPPDIGVRWCSDYISGAGHGEGRFFIIFDLARLFSAEEAMALVTTAVFLGLWTADIA